MKEVMKVVIFYIKVVPLSFLICLCLLIYCCVSQEVSFKLKELTEKENTQNTKGKQLKEIDTLRQDTKDVININFFYCTRIRNIAINNKESEIVSYKEDIVDNIKIHLSFFDRYVGEDVLISNIEIKKQYLITVEYDVDIKEGDILRVKDFFDCRVFRVVEIEPCYFGDEKTIETCYRKVGRVELLKLD